MYMVVLIFSIDCALPCNIFLTACTHSYIETVITLLRTVLYIYVMEFLGEFTNGINCKKKMLYQSDKLLHLRLPPWFAAHTEICFCVVDTQQDILQKIIF
jgi:hypothetical protein